jgi:hypothetical protein
MSGFYDGETALSPVKQVRLSRRNPFADYAENLSKLAIIEWVQFDLALYHPSWYAKEWHQSVPRRLTRDLVKVCQ